MLDKYQRMISIKGKCVGLQKVPVSLCKISIQSSRQESKFFRKMSLMMLKELIQTILQCLKVIFQVKFIVPNVQVSTQNQDVPSKKDVDLNVHLVQYKVLALRLNSSAKQNLLMLIVEQLNENLKKLKLALSQPHKIH